jgi:hypothetical protein
MLSYRVDSQRRIPAANILIAIDNKTMPILYVILPISAPSTLNFTSDFNTVPTPGNSVAGNKCAKAIPSQTQTMTAIVISGDRTHLFIRQTPPFFPLISILLLHLPKQHFR